MRPVDFPQANGTLAGFERVGPLTRVDDLRVFRDGGTILSCWRPSWRERLAVLFGRPVWLWVLAAKTHAPVTVEAKDPWVTS
jgi:hypothetical protein